ncbi:DUF221-domain-containing protein [Trametes versicolor FP-101664 SS1]|uniref:DUF221-domain-containing protein n=1 Tax=Trametes versicolor (strain FP-101664) TaxID=717944 RepID=UPI000462176D|nr:DUF221-domain-containing protein [Trametes versicolor FP-101664 SS1]EIW55322.1 DUF221-domain-containing protein [Trametes versicolor FP-101664 SS1]
MSSTSASNATSASTSTFITALVFNAAVFGIELGIFTLVRPFFPAIYQPRTYIPKKTRRAAELSKNILLWPWAVFNANYHEIRSKTGMDAYFFVRFLRMMVRVLVPIWLVSWAILLPATGVRSDPGTLTGLDRFTFGNVPPNQQSRYAAHIILAWFFTIWIGWNVRHEMKHFVTARQKWLIEPENASSAMASTVLITGVPRHYLTEAALTKLFSHLPGGVRKVWLNRDLKDMPDIYERRLAAAKKLESAEVNLVNTAVKLHNKKQKADVKASKKAGKGDQRMSMDTANDARPLTAPSIVDAEQGEVTLAEKLVPKNKRPSHRLPVASWMPFSLPLMGKQVDTIEWARQELTETNQLLHEARRQLARDVTTTSNIPEANTNHPDALKADPGSAQMYPALNSAFILFNNQIAAHMAAQVLTHHMPYRMATKTVGVSPKDVVWSNLNMNPYEARIRTAISWAITVGLIIVWAIPVAFIGVVSNVHSLCATYSWLAWLCDLPPVIVGIISGILPPALLAVLNMLLPIILRLLARFQGTTQRTTIELSLMSRYFLFLVINSFLVVTLSSGIITALPDLVKNPNGIPALLAKNLPKASSFFLTYIVLQGLSGTAAGFLQVVPLVLYYVKLFILGSTPRSIYNIKYTLRSVAWGTLFPSITLLVVITIAYSIISPIINGLSAVMFFLFYQMYKYLFIWQLDGQQVGETGGMFFPRAIQHVFVGMYLQQICLAALFFLAQDDKGKPSGVIEGALMIVLIVFTIFFHMIINNSYGPLNHYLPLTLADSTFSTDPNAAAAAQELDDQASYKEGDAENGEKRIARKRISPSRSIDSQSSGAATRGKAMGVSTVEDTATPGSPGIEQDEEEEDTPNSITGVDEDAGPKDFYHPASVEPQPTIWLPRDPLGLGEAEERANRAAGIKVSTVDAVMDGKGHVDISGPPPDLVL